MKIYQLEDGDATVLGTFLSVELARMSLDMTFGESGRCFKETVLEKNEDGTTRELRVEYEEHVVLLHNPASGLKEVEWLKQKMRRITHNFYIIELVVLDAAKKLW